MSMNRNDIIMVKELKAGYKTGKDHQEVLKNISFSVKAGELICLMGPNGAGKSTLLRCLAGMQEYHSGSIIIEDTPLADHSLNATARKMAVVLTEPLHSSHMTARELIAMGRYPHLSWFLNFNTHDRQLIKATAELCGVTHLLEKNIHSLSDGQRQKVLIARALAQESQLLILDEPTSHLDLNNRVEIINLLRHISRDESKAVIMATHELDLALQMADRLLLLNQEGRMIQGIPEDLVLNGQLDKVFAFKGYDLKTGKVIHPESGRKIMLKGEGYVYLWTKNALERSGYVISDTSEEVVYIQQEQELLWMFREKKFTSIEDLLKEMRCKMPL